jgi:tetratricopeptide (TPR) repeat protein
MWARAENVKTRKRENGTNPGFGVRGSGYGVDCYCHCQLLLDAGATAFGGGSGKAICNLQFFLPFIAFCVFILCWPSSSHAQSYTEASYRQANAYYEQGQYQQAVETYEQIAAATQHPAVYYNLGNAYFRLGKRGKAILNYERALALAPRDKDINFNLKAARARNVDGFDLIRPASGFSLLYGQLRPGEIVWVGLIPLWIAAASLVVFQFTQEPRMRRIQRYVVLIGGVAWLCSLALLGLKIRELNTPYAIVISNEVGVRSAPDVQAAKMAQPLHEGTKVQIQEKRGGWARIYLPEENAGWLPVDAVERI